MVRKLLHKYFPHRSVLYRSFLFVVSVFLIVYLFPKGGVFKYEFTKGQPWKYDNLYAPFDFAITKTEAELENERSQIVDVSPIYFEYNSNIANQAKNSFDRIFPRYLKALDTSKISLQAREFGKSLIDQIYARGVLIENYTYRHSRPVFLNIGHEAKAINFGQILNSKTLVTFINNKIENTAFAVYKNDFVALCYDVVKPNVRLHKELTQAAVEEELSKVLRTRGGIAKGSRIIAKGEVIEKESFQILSSLKSEYESQLWNEKNLYWRVLAYTILASSILLMLFLFLQKYRKEIYENALQFTFILFNLLTMVLITTLVVSYNAAYIYIVPLCMLPLVLKAFFDPRIGLFTMSIAVLILAFIAPNSFEYTFMQMTAGMVTILTTSESFKRANLFITVAKITLVYFLSFLAFHILQEGSLINLPLNSLLLFIISGFISLIVHPLIYVYEKVFGLISDVSLLELTDTNSKLLKDLSERAPGSFHHSLNVANLAEAAANEIGANALLVRVGALYHDIGKMENPAFFIENQATNSNPHDQLPAQESAKLIIDHVAKGIEIAKKNNLPDRVIDFIETHHGTSMVYYFFKKAEETQSEVDAAAFRYPGPAPFSKETAILMMSDSVEAAAKSLKNPTADLIYNFVEKIIHKQMEDGQFLNADITFKEIQQVKEVFKRKLINIYHIRVAYPD